MTLKAGMPYYLLRDGLIHDYPKLEKNIRTDVLIMGGGISGALTAYTLTKAGIQCTVVDGRTIGLGSTCASTSLLQYELDVKLVELIELIGKEKAVRSYHLCAEAIDKLFEVSATVGFKEMKKRPSLYYAAHKNDETLLREEYDARKEAGFEVEFLEQKTIQSDFGFSAPAAILSKKGAQSNSYLFTHAIHQYNINKGAEVYDRTFIAGIRHSKNGVSMQTKEGYRIDAKKLVYATGYEIVKYINKPIVKLKSTYAIASETLSSRSPFWKDDMMIWNTAIPYLYIRTTADRRIFVGGRDENFYSPGKRDPLIGKKSKQLAKDFSKLFPHLGFIPEFSWTGTFGTTKDGLPYIGTYPKLPNSYFALGFGGNGITFSMIAAELIAGMVKGKKNKDLELFSFDR